MWAWELPTKLSKPSKLLQVQLCKEGDKRVVSPGYHPVTHSGWHVCRHSFIQAVSTSRDTNTGLIGAPTSPTCSSLRMKWLLALKPWTETCLSSPRRLRAYEHTANWIIRETNAQKAPYFNYIKWLLQVFSTVFCLTEPRNAHAWFRCYFCVCISLQPEARESFNCTSKLEDMGKPYSHGRN